METKKDKPKVLFILGATGAGKSDLAVNLALKYNGEIISVDSVQVYRHFNIGSAKIRPEEMKGVIHYGIDIKDPNEEFSVYDFVEYTKIKIDEIVKRGKLPVIVGGTALYVKALIEGYNFGNTDKHEDYRKQVENDIKEFGNEFVYNKLKQINPKLASNLDYKNSVRLIRAMEIAEFGEAQTKTQECEYDFKLFAIIMDRQKLYTKINNRVDKMLAEGLIEEVEALYKKYGSQLQPMRAIGYKEVVAYLDNQIDKDKMIELIKQHTRNYAKRQLTFLRGLNNVVYIYNEDKNKAFDDMCKEIDKWL